VQIRQRVQPWMFVSAAWIVPAVFAAVDRAAQTRLNGWDPVTPRDLLWAGGDWLLYAFLTPFVFLVSRRWPLARPHLARRVMLHLGMSLVFCVVWATVGKLFQLALGLTFYPQTVQAAMAAAGDQFWMKAARDWLGWVFTTMPFGIAVYLCVVGVEHAIRYFIEAREREVQVARLSEQLAGARFAALQAQLNPHFLFNTLNTVAVRARDGDSAGAARMVEQLSDVLRRTLSTDRANEVALEEELDLVGQYLAIEQARFSDRLRPAFAVDPAARSAAVPGFAVQHLVENAIRHGIARRSDAGVVRVTSRRDGDALVITVTDDGLGIDAEAATLKGHGIENTRERLRALYGGRASLLLERGATGGTTATLRLPYREMLLETDRGAG
jgi:two-component system, LytTR family, sensor kinase